jgi:hypothetical protein
MTDAALEEVMEWLLERGAEGRDVALRYCGGGHWVGEVWEGGDWNHLSGGDSALEAALATYRRVAARTEPRRTRAELEARLRDLQERHDLDAAMVDRVLEGERIMGAIGGWDSDGE